MTMQKATGKSMRGFDYFRSIEIGLISIFLNCSPIGYDKKFWQREGGQAEIFEVEDCRRKSPYPRYVLKVFKKGYSLRDLSLQWPQGILDLSYDFNVIGVRGGVVLEDGRFAFLLPRCHIHLRKLIDSAQEDNPPLGSKPKASPGIQNISTSN